jgi:molybdopterin converting factor small subunit
MNSHSGDSFEEAVQEYLNAVVDWDKLQVTLVPGEFVSVHIIRCRPFQDFLNLVKAAARGTELGHQHHAFKRFLNAVFFNNRGRIETPRGPAARRGRRRDILRDDLLVGSEPQQIKTSSNLPDGQVGEFLAKYLPQIIVDASAGSRWWLTFLREIPPKSRKGRYCYIYLVLLEVEARRVVGVPLGKLRTEVTQLVQDAQAKVKQEDELSEDEDFLVPVKNFWVVDALRDELAGKDQVIAEKDEALAEKDEALAEKDEALAEKDREIAALKKRLSRTE